LLKFGAFAVTMVILTAFLFMMFGQYRTESTYRYSAVFASASRLKAGDSVRAAGIRVGTVRTVELAPDDHVVVTLPFSRRHRSCC
jgi:phospholipid/cholesterol/gamma-HCH transport system substrate-binding protein